jgi:hypothetical protein
MATILLSAVGFALGGPIGAAIGAAVGQQVDQRVFAPKARQGPRLNDLKIQTSSYATPLPKVFGTMRLSGTVIWATDLREERRKVSGGKGAPKTTVYSYSASFAVALSSRPVGRIGRIWADGKLLRGTAGDFKTPTGFRLHNGDEGQSADPLIAAAEGAADTPAYRGIAYAVFEDFQLADYGNRIPSLSFEVIADEGSVTVGQILNGIAPLGFTAACPTQFGGFAAYGSSVLAVCQSIQAAVPFYLRDDGTNLRALEAEPLPKVVPQNALGASVNAATEGRINIEQQSASTLASRLSVTYFEPDRDYQSGRQQARRDGGARREDNVEIAATLNAAAARQLAERGLSYRWAGRKRARVSLPWRYLDIGPGATVTVSGITDVWHVAATSFEKMTVALDLVRASNGTSAALAAAPGRGVGQTDVIHGPTRLVLLDLPPLDDGISARPVVAVAAAGVSPGWRGAALLFSIDDGVSWQEAGSTAAPTTLGASQSVLPIGSADLIDDSHSLDVELLNDSMILGSADDDGLIAGLNLAMIGNELIQFGRVEQIAPKRFRLRRLLRGRRGTSVQTHSSGTEFVLIERDTLAFLDVPAGLALVRANATGVGDVALGVEASLASPAQAVTPLPPVHLRTDPDDAGGFDIRWTRQSRDGWRWPDSVDVPLGEEQEFYRVVLAPNFGAVRTFDTTESKFTYSAVARSADQAAGASDLLISISQVGTLATSPPATINISIL